VEYKIISFLWNSLSRFKSSWAETSKCNWQWKTIIQRKIVHKEKGIDIHTFQTSYAMPHLATPINKLHKFQTSNSPSNSDNMHATPILKHHPS
jgi:hypothetical protein